MKTPKTVCAAVSQLLAVSSLVHLAGCLVGPNYTPPEVTVPASYEEPGANGGTPYSHETRWWRTFEDSELTSLVERAVVANNNVAVAEARLREARAARRIARSFLSGDQSSQPKPQQMPSRQTAAASSSPSPRKQPERIWSFGGRSGSSKSHGRC